MALFKINRGGSNTLPSTLTDGWAYFCTDTGEFFIDFTDSEGNLQRKAINAHDAYTLGGVSLVTLVGEINKKVSKVDGKGLSTNDYTNEDKEKLLEISIDLHTLERLISTKADTDHNHDSDYDTKGSADSALTDAKNYVDNMEFITVEDIDAICGSSIQVASEVTF